jgi:hypothetical protein
MRYLLPIVVCAAIGALVIVLVRMGDGGDRRREADAKPPIETAAVAATTGPLGAPRNTPTSLAEHQWLSELERVMGREDMSRAGWFRQKICEDLESILRNPKLKANLLALIRKYGTESEDPKRRDVALGMLRVLEVPEAKELIETAWYQSRDEDEQLGLLEAMAKPWNDPQKASIWAIEKALNSQNADVRMRAYQIIAEYAKNDDVIIETAFQIVASTTHSDSKFQVLNHIAQYGARSERIRNTTRALLKNPSDRDMLGALLGGIDAWGTEDDARQLEVLAQQMPEMSDIFKERAFVIREARRALEGGHDQPHVGPRGEQVPAPVPANGDERPPPPEKSETDE